MVLLMGASGYAAIISKIALREVAPLHFVWLSLALGLPLLAAVVFMRPAGRGTPGRLRALGLDLHLRIAAIGILSYAVVRWLFLNGLERLPATTQAFLVNLVGITTMGLSAILLRETPARRQILGALIVLVGVKVFFREIPAADARTGIVFVLTGVFALALVNVLTRDVIRRTGPSLPIADLTFGTILVGAPPILVYGVFAGYATTAISGLVFGAAALNAAVGMAFGPLVFNHVLRTLRAYEASVLAATAIIWVGILAIPLLDEHLVSHQYQGIAVMIGGLVLTQWRPRARVATA